MTGSVHNSEQFSSINNTFFSFLVGEFFETKPKKS